MFHAHTGLPTAGPNETVCFSLEFSVLEYLEDAKHTCWLEAKDGERADVCQTPGAASPENRMDLSDVVRRSGATCLIMAMVILHALHSGRVLGYRRSGR